MPIIPNNFDGDFFNNKFNKTRFDWRVEDGNLICPSLPNLTEEDLIDCVVNLVAYEENNLNNLTSRQKIKDEYQNVTSRLQQIVDADPSGLTQAQFNQQAFLAIQDIAQFVLWIIKFIARFVP